ncbi:MAG: MmcQ/YjbR family DNA-binding protein [Balneolaceae bacterium]|nr:MmcQ/YjbR family DNA-binding protein [Balneolaceae bacterium]
MTVEDFRNYCLHFRGAREDLDKENRILAFKVLDHTFALADPDSFDAINLKCDPVKAAMLRGLYEEVVPGDVDDKKNWNAVDPHGSLGEELIKEWIKDSYELVIEAMPRKEQKKLEKD